MNCNTKIEIAFRDSVGWHLPKTEWLPAFTRNSTFAGTMRPLFVLSMRLVILFQFRKLVMLPFPFTPPGLCQHTEYHRQIKQTKLKNESNITNPTPSSKQKSSPLFYTQFYAGTVVKKSTF